MSDEFVHFDVDELCLLEPYYSAPIVFYEPFYKAADRLASLAGSSRIRRFHHAAQGDGRRSTSRIIANASSSIIGSYAGTLASGVMSLTLHVWR
jgi:hypothetical protein